jgi:hypothetical protein
MTDSEFAKTHLKEHLASLLVTPVCEGFWSIYKSSVELCERNGQMDQLLRTFQNMVTRIPEWSDATLSTEVERIVKVSKCGYLDDLLMGVFIAYMKSFASLQYRGSSSEINVEFDSPSVPQFVHELYKHSARKIWQVAYLFKTIGVTMEQQARNRQEVERLVVECMELTIRGFLPWEAIAKKYFSQPKQAEIITEIPEVVESKAVSFDEEDDDSGSEDEYKEPLTLSEEVAEIQFEDLDKKQEVVEKSPMDELSEKVSDTLVLNL